MTRKANIQIDFNSRPIGKIVYACIPWVEHKKCFDEFYAPRYGNAQSAERISERGGFGIKEAVKYGYDNPLVFWFSEKDYPKKDSEWKKVVIRFNGDHTYSFRILTEDEYKSLDLFDKIKDTYDYDYDNP